jgi:hypothetical protein
MLGQETMLFSKIFHFIQSVFFKKSGVQGKVLFPVGSKFGLDFLSEKEEKSFWNLNVMAITIGFQ